MRDRLSDGWAQELDRDAAVRLAVQALAGPDRSISADELEVAVLAAGNGRRCFRRLDDAETEGLLADGIVQAYLGSSGTSSPLSEEVTIRCARAAKDHGPRE